jgi:hypothetical protein
MLVSLARSSMLKHRTPAPPNSNTRPTPGGSAPSTSMRSTSGVAMRTAPVMKALALSVVPTPKATQPSASLCGVRESVPTISSPGSA